VFTHCHSREAVGLWRRRPRGSCARIAQALQQGLPGSRRGKRRASRRKKRARLPRLWQASRGLASSQALQQQKPVGRCKTANCEAGVSMKNGRESVTSSASLQAPQPMIQSQAASHGAGIEQRVRWTQSLACDRSGHRLLHHHDSHSMGQCRA